MKIAIDIDGVVTDFVSTFRQVVREAYDRELRYEDIYVHDLFLVLGVTEERAIELIRKTLSLDLVPMPGALDGLARLSESHEVVLVTARPPDMMGITAEWLRRHKVPHHGLINLREGEKHGHGDEFDVVIDDHLRELVGFVGKAKKLIIFDHPWNRTLNVEGLFYRARGWSEVVRIIEDA